MKLEVIIGLETHIQLKTKSKLFCGCSNHESNTPNANVCPVCVGHPGTLPVPNEQAVRWAVLLGLALGGEITPHSKFDRKHYFYPDLPKAYQISQFDLPIMHDGSIDLDVPGEDKPVTIRIERLHLEEDAAKNIHGDDGKSYVDFNRGGTPLCEIVSRPDISSAAQAKAYMQELRIIARTLGVSDGNMEKGHLRCDVNISLRPEGEEVLYTKTEIKNVNSFKAVERVIEYEIKRQTHLWEAGNPPSVLTTRGWNDAKQITEEQRVKEDAADYRYFPEPDIPPMDLRDMATDAKRRLPELPRAKRKRFVEEYGFKIGDVRMMVDDPKLAEFTEQAMSELAAWLTAKPELDDENILEYRKKLAKLTAGWLLNKLMGLLGERKGDIRTMKVNPENFAEFITMIADGKLTGRRGLEVLGKMLETGGDPSNIVEDLGAQRLDDVTALATIVETVIEENSSEVERYRGGETKLIKFFVGQVMKASRGNADPQTSEKILKDKLK
ncbi:Asp-tRNA(Asn)/Glu-tRNA(Gln) amidotransferase subunit GatB [Candidatus Uhrbacteria bacterium]|jgi:aspartyl-tRNA(Asn)/glutamyl-tRNA(Gln) amidotransferase subunit B|nr:Asp-tRNA(Asn)/Glu-tRNA(Gln) amidotransferase subunit GatB [Candidatus Uhrbacteria bacterium]